jgi:D-3-phosphoglycerate dehydrogenase
MLKGFLEGAGGKDVNQVNVRVMAKGLGLVVEEIKSNEETDFNEWIHVAVYSGGEKVVSAGGTTFGARSQPRIVRLNSRTVEIVPEGVLFIMNNNDRPGIVGHVGTLMGKHNVNIASMTLNRDKVGGQALTILNVDTAPPKSLIEEIEKDPDISNVRIVTL